MQLTQPYTTCRCLMIAEHATGCVFVESAAYPVKMIILNSPIKSRYSCITLMVASSLCLGKNTLTNTKVKKAAIRPGYRGSSPLG